MASHIDPPFVVVRSRTGTPGGVADSNFSLPELMAMMRHARQVVHDSRQTDDPGAQAAAQQEILAVFGRSAMAGDRGQARAVLAAYLIREAQLEDVMMRQAQQWQGEQEHAQFSARARDVDFSHEPLVPQQASVGRVYRGGATPPHQQQQRAAVGGMNGMNGMPVDNRGDGLTMEAIEAARAERRAARAQRGKAELAQEKEEARLAALAAAQGAKGGQDEGPSAATLYREARLAEMAAQKDASAGAAPAPAAPSTGES